MIVINVMTEIGNHGEKGIWPTLDWATWWFDRASFGLIVGTLVVLVSTVLIVWMGIVKEHHWDTLREQAGTEIVKAQGDAATANEAAGRAHERAAALEVDAEKVRLELGNANIAIAEANARAAEANQKAEAERVDRLKLELRVAPRRLGPERQARLSAALRPILSGIGVDLIVYEHLGPDVAPLAQELAKTLGDAGVTVRVLTPLPGGAFATGIVVRAEVTAPANVLGAVQPTANAVSEAGLDAGPWEPFPADEPPASAYNGPGGLNSNFRILVGAKP
jgi:hypothetical protein